MKTIDFEAHFFTNEYVKALYDNKGYPRYVEDPKTGRRRCLYAENVYESHGDVLLDKLLDHSSGRLKLMDDAGVDVQVLSLSAPGVERFAAGKGSALARSTNDELSQIVKKHPDRFLGFCALAPQDPDSAVTELERAVKELGMIGWKTHSNFGDTYLDDPRYRPILKKAEELDVPIYLHPSAPAISQLWTYGFALAGAPFGFGLETSMCMMRMILGGVFDDCPTLKIMLGHYGEALPFQIERVNFPWDRPWFEAELRPELKRVPGEVLRENMYVTTSGNNFKPAFQCTYDAIGIEHILLGTDFPYEDSRECIDFIEGLPIAADEKAHIYFKNAATLGIDGDKVV